MSRAQRQDVGPSRECKCHARVDPSPNSRRCLHSQSESNKCSESDPPVGYCFDVAIGLADLLGIKETSSEVRATRARDKLVELALARSADKRFRELLAPEIRHAAALTVEFMNFGIPGSEANILPSEMCTQELQVLVNRFFDAPNDERVKAAVTACNDALGRSNGSRLPVDGLKDFFQNSTNCKPCWDSYRRFNEVWENIVEPADNAFTEYCSQETTYRKYIESYYGNGGWFAFQREFATECSTSMVDVTAKLLELTVTIYDSNREVYYRTDSYGINEIGIVYNGVDHFTMLSEPLTTHCHCLLSNTE